jgi:hypothetical protein
MYVVAERPGEPICLFIRNLTCCPPGEQVAPTLLLGEAQCPGAQTLYCCTLAFSSALERSVRCPTVWFRSGFADSVCLERLRLVGRRLRARAACLSPAQFLCRHCCRLVGRRRVSTNVERTGRRRFGTRCDGGRDCLLVRLCFHRCS